MQLRLLFQAAWPLRGSEVLVPPPPKDGVLEHRSQQANPIKHVCDLAERRRRARLMRRRPRPERVGSSPPDEHICGSVRRGNRQLNYWLCREDGVTFSCY